MNKVIIAIVVVLSSLALTCTSTKDTQQSKTNVDSSLVKKYMDSTSFWRQMSEYYKSERDNLLEYGVFFDNPPCDTNTIRNQIKTLIGVRPEQYDSLFEVLTRTRNKVQILSDGSIKAEGNVKSAIASKKETERIVSQKSDSIKILIQRIQSDSLSYAKKESEKTKQKQTDVAGGSKTFIWIILAYLLGALTIIILYLKKKKHETVSQ